VSSVACAQSDDIIKFDWWAGNTTLPDTELSLNPVSQVLPKAEWLSGDSSPRDLFSSKNILYVNGKTFVNYVHKWTTGEGAFGRLIVYDKNNGIYPAGIETTKKGGEGDRHLMAVIGRNDDGTYVVLEENKHVENINVFYGSSDFSSFVEQPTITSLASRHNLFKTASGWAILHQYNQDELYVNTFASNGTGWGTAQMIIDGTSSSRTYMQRPIGADKDANGWYRFIVMPFYTDGAIIHVKFVIKTQDFVTFWNEQESHSFTAASPMTDATLDANNYEAIGRANVTAEYDPGGSCISNAGKLYIFSWSGTSGDGIIKTTTFKSGAWQTTTTNTGLDIRKPTGAHTTVRFWSCIRNETDIYLMVTVTGKPHLLKSTNEGTTWTDLGDMIPDQSSIYSGQGPFNTLEIPDNENFVFVFNENLFDDTIPVLADLYVVRAAFGTIQAETSSNYTTSLTAINDIAGARFIYEADDYDATVTGFYDKTGGGRTGTKVGTPTLSSGAVTFNGTNQSIAVTNPLDFASDTQFTYSCVVKVNSGTAHLFSGAVTSSATAFVSIQLTATNLIVFRRSPSGTAETIQVNSMPIDGTIYNIFTIQGDGSHYRLYVNGVEMNKTYTIGSGIGDLIKNGLWMGSVAGMNSVRLSGLGRSGPSFSATSYKEAAYWPSVINRTNRKKLENFLSTKYSIAITNKIE